MPDSIDGLKLELLRASPFTQFRFGGVDVGEALGPHIMPAATQELFVREPHEPLETAVAGHKAAGGILDIDGCGDRVKHALHGEKPLPEPHLAAAVTPLAGPAQIAARKAAASRRGIICSVFMCS